MKENQDMLIAEALRLYGETVTPAKKSAQSEAYRIGNILRCPIAMVSLARCTARDIAAHRDLRIATAHQNDPKKTLSPGTVKHELMLLSNLFTIAATEWGMQNLENPVAKVRKPKTPPGRTRRLRPEEEKKLMRALDRHPNKELKAIVRLALETGGRQGELLSLSWENISFRKRVAHLESTKNGEQRDIPLSRQALVALESLTSPAPKHGKVFSYTNTGVKSAWRSITKSLCIEDLHFHDLRHEAISRLFEKGLDAIEVATISGHKSMQMLKRYTHLSAYKLVAKLDKLDKRQKSGQNPAFQDIRPYLAILTYSYRFWHVEFLDFPGLSIRHRQQSAAVSQASAELLRELIVTLRKGRIPPDPTPCFLPVRTRCSEVVLASILPI